MPDDEPEPGPKLERLDPETQFRNLLEWVYIHTDAGRAEREEFVRVLRFNLLEKHS